MGKIYRVFVIEQDDSTYDRFHMGSGAPRERVIFEAAGADPERMLAYVPTEVAAALGEQIGLAIPDRVTAAPAVPATVTEAPAAGVSSEADAMSAALTEDPPPVKRKRRTRAEIEADKAAAEAAALASQAGADSGPESEAAIAEAAAAAATPDVQMATTFAGAAPVPAGDGKPWNPFEK